MTMRRFACTGAALLALALLAGCGGSSSSSTQVSTAAKSAGGAMTSGGSSEESGPETIKATTGDLGTILVDGEGKTLYLFERDRGPHSTCSGACLEHWPAVTTDGRPRAGGGADASQLGTSARGDGTTQVTYAGHPLYYFAGDHAAGDTNGQGIDAFGAEWYVLGPDGATVEGQESSDGSSPGGY